MEIKSYYVGTHRQRESSNFHRRWINLVPKVATSEVEHIVIYFFIDETIANDSDVGYTTPASTKFIVGYSHISDFEDMYKILQSERPIFFNWAADTNNSLIWFQISTNEERIGEGPSDSSSYFWWPWQVTS